MQERKDRAKEHPDSSSGHVGESVLESPREVVVTHHSVPPKTRAVKPIHPRRPLPQVPTGSPQDDGDDEKETHGDPA